MSIKNILKRIGEFLLGVLRYTLIPVLYVAFLYGDKHGWFDEID